MKRTAILLTLLLVASVGRAQLRSVGEVPADLKMSVQELYDDDLKRAKKYAGGRVKNKQQVLEASYQINKMLAGGHIVYGDPISRMVERIADTLLADYPELRSELRFYTVTSPEVNAFATGQGMVFINAGLVAQVDDEAQLAFIISHEIIHYYRSHNLESIIGKKKRKKDEKADIEEGTDQTNDFIRRHNRSREMESEADSLGIALFYLKSPYDKENVTEGVFDVLQYSALPFDDLTFDTTFFNTPYFSLTGCWLDTVAGITSRDNYDDSRSTHPNIISRRRNCAASLDGYYGGERFVVTTPEEFYRLRQIARMECIRQEIIHGQYARAFYNTWLLQSDTTLSKNDHASLDLMMAQELYGLAMFKNNDMKNTAVGDYKEVEGESQQVHYAMSTMPEEHATIIALHNVWENHRRYPDNKQLEKMASDLMEMLRLKNSKSITDFVSEPPSDATDTVSTPSQAAEQTDKPKTKYERIKQKRAVLTKRNPTSYALTDILSADKEFHNLLREHLAGNAPKEPPIKAANEDSAGVIVFNPTYWVVSYRKEYMNISESDSRENELTSRIMHISEKFKRNGVDFSDGGMHNMESDVQYNDFLSLCEWSNEFWLNKGNFDVQRFTQPAMNDLMDRYQARIINYTAVLNIEGTPPDASPGYIIILPITPIVALGMFTGIEHTGIASVMVDAREGKVLSRQSYSFNVADHGDVLDAAIHDTYVHAMKPDVKTPKGFMGKRLALMGGFNLGMAGYQTFEAGHYVALSPWAAVEFAIKRDMSISVWGRYHKGYDDITTNIRTEQDYYPWFQDITTQNSRNMLMAGISIHDYKRSEFAPLGLYLNYGLHMVRFTKLDSTPDGYTFGAHLGVGRNHVFLNTLVLNYEVNYAYTYGLHKTIDFDFSDTYKHYLHYADAILANIVTVRLGIGILPF